MRMVRKHALNQWLVKSKCKHDTCQSLITDKINYYYPNKDRFQKNFCFFFYQNLILK